MMVKNQTDHAVFTGGAVVPPDGDFHQVKDTPGTREALQAGTLTQKRERQQSSSQTQEPGDSNDDGGDDS